MVSALLAGRGGHGRWTPMLVRADVATMSLGSTYLVTIVVKRHPRSNHQHQWYPGNMRPPLREQWSEKFSCQVSNFWVKSSIAAIWWLPSMDNGQKYWLVKCVCVTDTGFDHHRLCDKLIWLFVPVLLFFLAKQEADMKEILLGTIA